MPMYVIERNFAEQLDVQTLDKEGVNLINEEVGVRWLYSFCPPTRRRPTASTRRRTPMLCERPPPAPVSQPT